jgi:hypothetical protein
VVSIPFAELKDMVVRVLRGADDFVDDTKVGFITKDSAPSVEFEEKSSDDSGEHDIRVRPILESPGFGLKNVGVRSLRWV